MRRTWFNAFKAAVCFTAALISAFGFSTNSAFAAEEKPGSASAYILYDNSSGLPTSEANAIVQSKDGFIWIGGYSGLIRYDGIDFTRFDSSYGITSVVSLYIDSSERLWIGTSDNGAVLYDNGEFTFYGRNEGLESLFIHAITEDANGNIVFGTTEGVAYIDREGKLHKIDDPRTNSEYVCEVIRDNDGIIYGMTLDGAFFSIEDLKVTHFYSGEGLDANCISPDLNNKGYVYMGTHGSKVLYGKISDGMASRTVLSAAPQTNINAIRCISGNTVWVCADNGIGYFDKDHRYCEMKGTPMNNSVDEMMQDFEGNLWFASSRQGIMKIVGSEFTDIMKEAGLEATVVNSTCVYNGELYIGADTGLFILDKDRRPVINDLTQLLEGVRIRCIKNDSKGNLWLCTYGDGGLICVGADGSKQFFNTDAGMISNRARAVTELSDGTIAAAMSGGLNLIRDGKITGRYDESSGITNTEILSVCDGGDGSILLGSDGGGMYIINGESLKQLGIDDGLRSEIILRIKKDPVRGIFWIITSNSISYMEKEKITTIKNFPYSNNFDMYFDKDGGIWILSSNGIYVMNGDNLKSDTEMEYTFYNVSCGLPSIPTANSRSFLAEDGTLYIAGSAGASSVNINTAARSTGAEIKLAVPFVDVDDKQIMIDGGTVTIPANCKRLTIYDFALSYKLGNPTISYCLEGFDTKSITVSKNDMHPVIYTNLDSGTYTFRLSVLNSLTGKEEKSISVKIVKEKAFYEYLWFKALITAAAAGVIFLSVMAYIKYKNKKFRAEQEETEAMTNQIIRAFAKCIDFKDKYTNGHSLRVAEYSEKIAVKMGYDKKETANIKNIALLHDIGKITIPTEIINKPTKLTDEEFEIVRQHTTNGYDILKEIEKFPNLALGARYHHEHIDGSGYPAGIKGEEIPLIVQIIAVADTFDAMYSTRTYRKQMDMGDVVDELKRASGTQLNADIVNVLLGLIESGEIK